MKKRKLISLFALIMTFLMFASVLASCGLNRDDDDPDAVVVDSTKSQLYVFNFNGGFGSEWLREIRDNFEKDYENESFEKDKKGVQIHITANKTSNETLINTLATNNNEIFFSELAYVRDMINRGLIMDISEAVKGSMSEFGESGTIEDKLSAEQKDYLSSNGKYYALPHYEAYSGLTYNVDIFEDYKFYLSDNKNNGNDGFVRNLNEKKSAGVDGVYGTDDDGLPATYDEFYKLCAKMKHDGVTPIVFSGKSKIYVDEFVMQLCADYEGKDQTALNYTFNGTATNIAKLTGGEPTFTDGKLNVETADISIENGYKMFWQAGKFYGLKFVENFIKNGWISDVSTLNTTEHLDAQKYFLNSNILPEAEKIGMLVEGCWWHEEASDAFNNLESLVGDNVSKQNRRVAWMPLPKADASKIGQKRTMVDILNSMCYANANVDPAKKDLVLKFIKYCYSDKSLREFTTMTNTFKGVKYTLNDEDYNKLSYFGKTLYNTKQNSDIVRAYSGSVVYTERESEFFWGNLWLISKSSAGDYNLCVPAFSDSKITAEQYFKGIVNNFSKENWDKAYKDKYYPD